MNLEYLSLPARGNWSGRFGLVVRFFNAAAIRCGSGKAPGAAIYRLLLAVVVGLVPLNAAVAQDPKPAAERPAAQWKNGPSRDENYFPIGVWCQSPKNAARYQAAGINLYVSLWQGPTSEQLAGLQQAGMPVICAQNEVGLANKEGANIIGWMHGDEPDNAQPLGKDENGKSKGYGPPIPPQKIVADYEQMRATDPTRPVMLNLGQGVVWDNWKGRGVRTRHPEDYAEYAKGGDIVSFDIYPVTLNRPEVAGKLEFVGRGVERLVGWTQGKKPVWSCIECTHIGNPEAKATPAQVRSEVWMALINGARGLIYFVHEFKPAFNEAALLSDPEMLAGVTAINAQIRELAPVLNRPTLLAGVAVKSSDEPAPIAVMAKQHGGKTYVFAVNMSNQPTQGTFELHDAAQAGDSASVRYESRSLPVSGGQFADQFEPYQVHIYELPAGK